MCELYLHHCLRDLKGELGVSYLLSSALGLPRGWWWEAMGDNTLVVRAMAGRQKMGRKEMNAKWTR